MPRLKIYTGSAWEDVPVGGSNDRGAWVANTSYAVGDIVTQGSDADVYRCKTANSDATFTATKWDQLSGGGGGASIVGTKDYTGISDNNFHASGITVPDVTASSFYALSFLKEDVGTYVESGSLMFPGSVLGGKTATTDGAGTGGTGSGDDYGKDLRIEFSTTASSSDHMGIGRTSSNELLLGRVGSYAPTGDYRVTLVRLV